jgi:serine/threonine protein kinase
MSNKKSNSLKITHIMQIFAQIVLGMESIHSKGYSHRDLKPGNILINKNGRVMIADFGWSK